MRQYNQVPPSERFAGKWRSILPAVGIDKILLNGKNQPCFMCGGKDRFRWTNHNERGGYFCSRCDHGDGIAFVMNFLKIDFKEAVTRIDAIAGTAVIEAKRDESALIERMIGVWDSGQSISPADPAGLYLRGRGYSGQFPRALRYVPRLRYDKDAFAPAMIAKVASPSGRAVNVHRTWLSIDGHKAPIDQPRKMMAGEIPHGSAIRLFDHSELLGIAEGIETALMASVKFDVPVWSVISEGGIKRFTPPPSVTRLTIFGDNDANFVGQAAAYQAAKDILTAARKAGRELEIDVQIPNEIGTDWADNHYHRKTLEEMK
jgi:putative DNA primase/helicase